MLIKDNPKTYVVIFLFIYAVFLLIGSTAFASEISGTLSTDLGASTHFSEISGTLTVNNDNNTDGKLVAIVTPPSTTFGYVDTGADNISDSGSNTVSSQGGTSDASPFGGVLSPTGGPSDSANNNYLTYAPNEYQSVLSDNVGEGDQATTPLLPDTGTNDVAYNSLNGPFGQSSDQVAAVDNTGFDMGLIATLGIIAIIILASIGYALSRPGRL